MITQEEKQEILELINEGFDINLISRELGLSLETLQQFIEEDKRKKEIAINNSKKETTPKKVEKEKEVVIQPKRENVKSDSKMDKIRNMYKQVYNKSNLRVETYSINRTELTPEQNELVEEIIEFIEGKLKVFDACDRKERRANAIQIVKEFKKIEDLSISMAQAERLYQLMNSKGLENLNTSTSDRIEYNVAVMKRNIGQKLAEAVEAETLKTDDCDEIKELLKKVPLSIERENRISVGAIKRRIEGRINNIQQQLAIYRVRNEISVEIRSVLKDLVDGNLDIENLNKKIEAEVERRSKIVPKGRLALSRQQQKKQAVMQLRMVLGDRGEKYPIKDAKETITVLYELSDKTELPLAVRTVVKNLIGQKQYGTALEICSGYIQKHSWDYEESEISKYVRALRKEVLCGQIGDMVLEKIKQPCQREEENVFIDTLEERLKKEKITLSMIKLGRSKDGLKEISLSDVWYKPVTKQK